MSVYIKGMEIPTTCAGCPLGHINAKRYAIECYAEYPTKLFDYDLARHSANPFCPLIPAPDHGRLIDADELHKEIERVKVEYFDGGIYDSSRIDGFEWAEACVDDTPTVIPASKEVGE